MTTRNPRRSRTITRVAKRKTTDLELRRTPLQARGQETFDRILAVTAKLLDEVGFEQITTNLIAKAAGINVATLYQYFPNKQAVLVALFERQTAQRSGLAENLLADLEPGGDWRKAIHTALEAVVEMRRATPGVIPLRQAMRGNPQLQEFDHQDAVNASRTLSGKLVQFSGIPRAEADLVARCAIETVTSLLDIWLLESGGRDSRIPGQIKLMLERYLAPYFESPRGRPRRARKAR